MNRKYKATFHLTEELINDLAEASVVECRKNVRSRGKYGGYFFYPQRPHAQGKSYLVCSLNLGIVKIGVFPLLSKPIFYYYLLLYWTISGQNLVHGGRTLKDWWTTSVAMTKYWAWCDFC